MGFSISEGSDPDAVLQGWEWWVQLRDPQKRYIFLEMGGLMLATKKKYRFWSCKNSGKNFVVTKLEGVVG